MSTRIAFTEAQLAPLVAGLGDGHETAAVVAASLVEDAATNAATPNVTLLAQVVTPVPEASYLERSEAGLSIASTGWVPSFRTAIAKAQVPVFVHTHPNGAAVFSERDNLVDHHLANAAHAFGATHYASVVIAGAPEDHEVVARLYFLGVDFAPYCPMPHAVDAVRVAGSGLRLHLPPAAENASSEPAPVFDRQVLMLGTEGDRTLRHVRAAIVGAGGTGTAVGTQLARLGLGELVIVDDDVVTEPTPTRGHGMTTADLGRLKVDVLAEHLDAIGLGTVIAKVAKPLNDPEAIAAIAQADVIFSCVDGHGARIILNRWAYAHVAPVIDVGVLVTPTGAAGDRRGVEIEQRVTWIAPGTACLLCRGRVDPALAYAENLDPDTRKRLAGEGYVQAAETAQPAVVTLTTSVAALGATEFLLRLTGLGLTDATELLLRSHVGELRRNRRPPRPGCFCTNPEFVGRGTRAPYLDLIGTWA